MKLFVIFTTIVVYTNAAPMLELLHPSPVNPDVLVAVKPEEKLVLITDPKEVAKFKRETKQPLYPTVLPKEHENHVLKHNQKISGENSKHEKVLDFHKPHALPLLSNEPGLETEQHKRDIASYSISKLEESLKEGSKNETPDDSKSENSRNTQHKRDIPVPLVPKYQHPEESPKEYNEDSEKLQIHPTAENEQKHISKDGQEKPHALSAIPKESNQFEQQQKRETSSSIPNSKSIEENHLGKNYEEIKTLSSGQPQTLSKDKQATSQGKSTLHHGALGLNIYQPYYLDHIQKLQQTDGLQKTQMLPTSHHDQKESKDNKKDEIKGIESHTLSDSVKAEKTSESKLSHTSSTQYDQKPNIQIDNLSAPDSFVSTTEHPLSRHRPVPVAELFTRSHEN